MTHSRIPVLTERVLADPHRFMTSFQAYLHTLNVGKAGNLIGVSSGTILKDMHELE